jgi:hypothetical protein
MAKLGNSHRFALAAKMPADSPIVYRQTCNGRAGRTVQMALGKIERGSLFSTMPHLGSHPEQPLSALIRAWEAS